MARRTWTATPPSTARTPRRPGASSAARAADRTLTKGRRRETSAPLLRERRPARRADRIGARGGEPQATGLASNGERYDPDRRSPAQGPRGAPAHGAADGRGAGGSAGVRAAGLRR
ncbi:hypothetical protein MICRO8M_100129 [Microbacterium sp. 8M]|nr:hypothetical protein MICRO8M_100129 [Microbacterium sp. 8M]